MRRRSRDPRAVAGKTPLALRHTVQLSELGTAQPQCPAKLTGSAVMTLSRVYAGSPSCATSGVSGISSDAPMPIPSVTAMNASESSVIRPV